MNKNKKRKHIITILSKDKFDNETAFATIYETLPQDKITILKNLLQRIEQNKRA